MYIYSIYSKATFIRFIIHVHHVLQHLSIHQSCFRNLMIACCISPFLWLQRSFFWSDCGTISRCFRRGIFTIYIYSCWSPLSIFYIFFGPVLKQKWICTFDFDQPGVACPAVPIDWAAWQRNVTRAMMETSNAPLYYNVLYGGFPKWGYPKNGWFILDIPNIKWMVYTGVVHPYFRKPPCI